MRILALDVGDKRIGVAISDATCTIAQPLTTLKKAKSSKKTQKDDNFLSEVAEIIKKYEVKEVIVGLPYNLDGSLSKKAREILEFKDRLEAKSDVDIKTYDERYSSKIAESLMIDQDVSRKKRKTRIDRLAAQIILQDYLNYKNNSPQQGENL